MSFQTAFFTLLGACMIREAFFMFTVHRLINKLMCRNLHEYELARSVYKRENQKATSRETMDLPEDDGLTGDLSTISGML